MQNHGSGLLLQLSRKGQWESDSAELEEEKQVI